MQIAGAQLCVHSSSRAPGWRRWRQLGRWMHTKVYWFLYILLRLLYLMFANIAFLKMCTLWLLQHYSHSLWGQQDWIPIPCSAYSIKKTINFLKYHCIHYEQHIEHYNWFLSAWPQFSVATASAKTTYVYHHLHNEHTQTVCTALITNRATGKGEESVSSSSDTDKTHQWTIFLTVISRCNASKERNIHLLGMSVLDSTAVTITSA